MEKSPVSMLQEIMIRHGSVPVYQEIKNAQGGKLNAFVIRVTCKGQSVDGVGANKKAAKHNAAEEMLKLLMNLNIISRETILSPLKLPGLLPTVTAQQRVTPVKHIQFGSPISRTRSVSPLRTVESVTSLGTLQSYVSSVQKAPALEEPFINYVGKLKEYCEVNKLTDPVYTFLNGAGMPHCCTFTARCTVMSMTAEASASTKKLAKHAVAKKIMEHIVRNINPFAANPASKAGQDASRVDLEKLEVEIMNLKLSEPAKRNDVDTEQTLDRYKQITNRRLPVKNIQISDYHTALRRLCCRTLEAEKESLMKFCQLKSFYHHRANEIKEAIHTTWRVKLEKICFRTNNGQQCIVGFRLDTIPAMLEVGVGGTNEIAEMNALLKLIKLFFVFMK